MIIVPTDPTAGAKDGERWHGPAAIERGCHRNFCSLRNCSLWAECQLKVNTFALLQDGQNASEVRRRTGLPFGPSMRIKLLAGMSVCASTTSTIYLGAESGSGQFLDTYLRELHIYPAENRRRDSDAYAVSGKPATDRL